MTILKAEINVDSLVGSYSIRALVDVILIHTMYTVVSQRTYKKHIENWKLERDIPIEGMSIFHIITALQQITVRRFITPVVKSKRNPM